MYSCIHKHTNKALWYTSMCTMCVWAVAEHAWCSSDFTFWNMHGAYWWDMRQTRHTAGRIMISFASRPDTRQGLSSPTTRHGSWCVWCKCACLSGTPRMAHAWPHRSRRRRRRWSGCLQSKGQSCMPPQLRSAHSSSWTLWMRVCMCMDISRGWHILCMNAVYHRLFLLVRMHVVHEYHTYTYYIHACCIYIYKYTCVYTHMHAYIKPHTHTNIHAMPIHHKHTMHGTWMCAPEQETATALVWVPAT